MNRMNVIKINYITLLYMLFMGLMMACGDVERGQYATDSVPPGQVSNVAVENVPGGAVLTYTLPNDDDLLYVKVVYAMSDGTQVEQKSSAYTTRIVVEGLGRAKQQTVQLICGDRSGNESAPYPVGIEPLDAPIYEILESVRMQEDFGGVKFLWDNPLRDNIVLTLFEKHEDGRFVEIQHVYSNTPEGKFNIRGYPAEEVTFAIQVRDRWRNTTGMKDGTYVPLFEEQLDRLKFGRWNPPGIPYVALTNWDVERLWDGLLTNPGFSTPNTVQLPQSVTFNMGQTAILNRLKVYPRTTDSQLFSGYDTKKFQLWASPHPNVSADFSTWLFLGEFTAVKPSGLPLGQLSDEDRAVGVYGADYIIELNNDVPVQYIRIYIMETWGGATVGQFMELEFFGNIIRE